MSHWSVKKSVWRKSHFPHWCVVWNHDLALFVELLNVSCLPESGRRRQYKREVDSQIRLPVIYCVPPKYSSNVTPFAVTAAAVAVPTYRRCHGS